jgi:hypothetical protein
MKCREANELIVAYLDGEVTPSEQVLIQSHLVGCNVCRKELAALSETQNRVSQSLQVRAAQADPSPQAWDCLQARLSGQDLHSPSLLPAGLQHLAQGFNRISQIFQPKGGITMKKGFVLVTLVVLIVALGMIAFIPSVRAQAGEMLNTWFRFKSPGGEYEVALSGPAEFAPLHPSYLPVDLQGSGVGISSTITGEGSESVELVYHNEDQFLTITQSKASEDKILPVGHKVIINGQKGVLVTDLEGTFKYGFRIPEGAQVETLGTPPSERDTYHGTITYKDGKLLTWFVGDVKVEMLSNLPEAEMLKIAESLVPAEAGEGESPFHLYLDLPTDGDEEVLETEGGFIIMEEGSIELNP